LVAPGGYPGRRARVPGIGARRSGHVEVDRDGRRRRSWCTRPSTMICRSASRS